MNAAEKHRRAQRKEVAQAFHEKAVLAATIGVTHDLNDWDEDMPDWIARRAVLVADALTKLMFGKEV